MKLYVGNLPYSIDDENLSSIFSEYGTVESATVITDSYTGQSKGFGFVEMSNQEEGNASIESLDGAEVDGRNIKVNVARERNDRGGRGGGGGNRRGGGGGGFRGNRY